MHLKRQIYTELIQTIQSDYTIRLILLHGGRGSGKTTLLHDLMHDKDITLKKYYFSFDIDLVAKKFVHIQDFVTYMELLFGVDFAKPGLLLLNEMHYSPDIYTILTEYIYTTDYLVTIVATGIMEMHSNIYTHLIRHEAVCSWIVRQLPFISTLHAKGLHTEYLTHALESSIVLSQIQHHYSEYLTRGGYPAVVSSTTLAAKKSRLKEMFHKIYEKDISFVFNTKEKEIFPDLMEILCQSIMMGYKVTSLCARLSITPRVLKAYMEFLTTHHIIDMVPYFWSNKHREISHQECLVIDDMGLISACTHVYISQLHNHALTRNFVYLELRYFLAVGDTIMTYRRTNGSVIDFIIVHADQTLTVIAVCMTDSICIPKSFHAFHVIYGHRVRQYVKTTHLTYHRGVYPTNDISSVPYVTIPYFFIKSVLTST